MDCAAQRRGGGVRCAHEGYLAAVAQRSLPCRAWRARGCRPAADEQRVLPIHRTPLMGGFEMPARLPARRLAGFAEEPGVADPRPRAAPLSAAAGRASCGARTRAPCPLFAPSRRGGFRASRLRRRREIGAFAGLGCGQSVLAGPCNGHSRKCSLESRSYYKSLLSSSIKVLISHQKPKTKNCHAPHDLQRCHPRHELGGPWTPTPRISRQAAGLARCRERVDDGEPVP